MNLEKIKETIEFDCKEANNNLESIKKIADKAYDAGFKNIFFAGSGGSITTLMAFAHYFKKYSSIPAYAEEAAELKVTNYKQLNKDSLVVIMAKTGTMVETVELSKYCKDNGIKSVGFVIIDNTPVANNVTYKVMISEDNASRYITIYQFLFRLMERNGDFDSYDEFMETLKYVPEIMNKTIDAYDQIAYDFAQKYTDEPFQLFIYSGALQGEALKYSADIAEELFRIRTQLMHCAEFFHGCLEIADDTLCIMQIMNVDESRVMDERCLRFLKKYASKKLTVFDPSTISMDLVKEEFRTFFVPMMVNVFLCTLVNEYIKEKTHMGASTRRYYQLVEY